MHRVGIHHRGTVMVLFAMLDDGLDYWPALYEWAGYEYEGAWSPDRWNSEICYQFLSAGIDVHPAVWMAETVRRVKDAN